MSKSEAATDSAFFPLFVKLRGRRVLVVGGNDVAARKIQRLLQAGALVDVIAHRLRGELATMAADGAINWQGEQITEPMIAGHLLIVVAEADASTRMRVRSLAERHQVLINLVDQQAGSSAIVPAVIDRSPIVIAVGSGGQAPELARMIRSRIEQLLPVGLGRLAALAGRFQARIRSRFPDLARRRQFLGWLFTGAPADDLAAGLEQRAGERIEQAIEQSAIPIRSRVSLVGAGPGDPELLTIRALRRIQEADVIVHDGLVDGRILEYARRDAQLIDVAKRAGECRMTQDTIHQLLLKQARGARRVVRLKGGDPMVFGRGGEELAWLRAHGIEYEVIPGVTAATACAAYAGIPLTHRGMAQSVRLVTAHCAQSIDRLDWPALAEDHQTLAFYMAVGQLELIEQRLIEHGRARTTPVALVENGTRPDQRVMSGQLDGLSRLGRTHAVQSPAMVYVGEVAALAGQLGWFGEAALSAPVGQPHDLRAIA